MFLPIGYNELIILKCRLDLFLQMAQSGQVGQILLGKLNMA